MAEKKKPNVFKRLGKYLRDVGNEFKKISWPGWPQTWKNTAAVLVTVLLFGVVVCGLDLILGLLRSLVLGAF